ncbi:MAG: ABC transporter substrate-binding protein, partial [Clostridiales bacterium]|nr:ABC transporter substrate-binding protein [Clostridiales bacterium]
MKKRTMLVLAAAATLLFAAGCNGGTGGGKTPGADDKEIVISLQTGNGLTNAYKAVAAEYEKLNEGVKVTVELKPTANYKEWLSAELAAPSTRPDIVDVSYNAADYRYFADYYDYLNDVSPYSGKLFKEQFNYGAQIPDAYTGRMLSISLERVQVLWIYNKEIFQLAGVREIPETWDGFIEACQKIAAEGYTPISMEGTYDGFLAGSMGHLFQIYNDQVTRDIINEVRAQEGDYCYVPSIDGVWEYNPADPFNDDPGFVNVNPVRLLKAVDEGVYRGDSAGGKFVAEQIARAFPQYAGGEVFFGRDDKVVPFYRGDAAMMMDGAYRIARYYRDLKEQNKLLENNP